MLLSSRMLWFVCSRTCPETLVQQVVGSMLQLCCCVDHPKRFQQDGRFGDCAHRCVSAQNLPESLAPGIRKPTPNTRNAKPQALNPKP